MAHPTSGVRLARRSLLELPALLALPQLPKDGDAATRLDFAAFARSVEELARAHFAGESEEVEALLLRLAEAGARLDPAGVPRPKLGRFGAYDPAVAFAPVHRAPPVVMIEWKLDPLARLPPHNHTPGYVLSLCLAGECRVEHFEIVGAAPAPGASGAFRLRRTRAQLLRPGHATSLTPDRDYVHTFRAGERGALGIDVNVFLPGEGDWSMIELEGTPGDGGFDELCGARWIGKPS